MRVLLGHDSVLLEPVRKAALAYAASDMPGMTDFADSIYRSEQQWKAWFDLEAPEVAPIPDFEERAT